MSFRKALAKAERISTEAESATDPRHAQAARIVVKAARKAGAAAVDRAIRGDQ
ncbi:hypothetical protein [Nonomuraea rubra]|uniref:hypothetical protein n=1 Tax=Nonomuraea rubra TaxID=46180 RepID=UPI0034003FAA